MLLKTNHTIKVNLSDYDVETQIQENLFFSKLTPLAIGVLEEIVYGSLNTSVQEVVSFLEIPKDQVLLALMLLEEGGLLKLSEESITVNKEKRKAFELLLMQQENDFSPDIEWILTLLSKVPIHLLPHWYLLSSMTDNIFYTIIEKYLLTPKIYLRYLRELKFEQPLLNEIKEELFQTKNLRLNAQQIREKHQIDPIKFEEYKLILAYHFVCYSEFVTKDGVREEFLVPMKEWTDFVSFQQQSMPLPIKAQEKIVKTSEDPFFFIKQLNSHLQQALISPLSVPEDNQTKAAIEWLLHLHLLKPSNKQLIPASKAEAWLTQSLDQQAITFYRCSFNALYRYTETEARALEKQLKKMIHLDWIEFDAFLKGCLAPIGESKAVSLQKRGKQWEYQIPSYSEREKHVIKTDLFDRLTKAAIISTGTYEGRPCFTFTPLGKLLLA